MASAGYNGLIYVALDDDDTSFTAEATSLFSGAADATVRQITTSSKNLWDIDTAIVVKDGVTTLTLGTDYNADYLYGRIGFQTYTPIGAITLDGAYLTPRLIGQAKGKWTHNFKPQILEEPLFGYDYVRRKPTGRQDADLTIERFDFGGTDYGSISGSPAIRFKDLLAAGTAVIFDMYVNGSSEIRMRSILEEDVRMADVAEWVQSTLTARLNGAGDARQNVSLSYARHYP